MMRLTLDILIGARREEGVATVEFALWSVFVLSVLLVGFDFGTYSIYQARLNRSVSEASNFAFANYSHDQTGALDAAAVTAISQYVTSSSNLPDEVDVTVTCNVGQPCTGGATGRACLDEEGVLVVAAEGSSCSTGGEAGFFVTVHAEYTYTPELVGNPLLEGAQMVQTSTVRLQ